MYKIFISFLDAILHLIYNSLAHKIYLFTTQIFLITLFLIILTQLFN